MRRLLLTCSALLALLVPARAQADAGVELDLETGVAVAGGNDVAIPGDSGTRLSLTEDLDGGVAPVQRVRLAWRFAGKHEVLGLVAPLRLSSSGTLAEDVSFAGGRFPAGSQVQADYRFDSYRLTYRYHLLRRARLGLALGLTGKVRDAEIRFTGVVRASKSNTGFVPLLNLRLDWAFRPPFGLLLEADALAAPQGRAEDVLLALTWRPRDDVTLRVGYRLLEGGADNDEVYNFALVHYGVAGVALRF